MRELTVNSLFCGVGGFDLGFEEAGFKIVGAWDYDKYAVQTYKENVGDYVKQADITQMTYKDMPKATVWSFGFPCQDLSIAGKQAGIKLKCNACSHEFVAKEGSKCPECSSENTRATTRSGLFFEVMRLLDETMKENPDNMPAILIAENVKGLKEYLPVLKEEYKKRGYTMYAKLHNSKYHGVPQNRERYFVVGIHESVKKEFSFVEEIKTNIPKLSSVLDEVVDEKYYVSDEKAQAIIEQALKHIEKLGNAHATLTPDRIEKRQNGRRAKEDEEEMFTVTAQDRHGVIQNIYTDKDGCAYCCDANYSKGTSPGDVGKCRRTHIIEETIIDDTYGYDGVRVYQGICPTLRSQRNGLKTVEEPKIKVVGHLDIKGQDCVKRVYDTEGLSPTLTTSQGGNRQPKILIEKLIVPEATKKGYAIAEQGDSVNLSHLNSKTRRGRVGKEIANTILTGVEQCVLINYRVRKLTPIEYGRLQGFPMDRWKQVVSDSQAYKQFGNAVTTNVAKDIATKIKETLEDK